jgi:hypothetical protein
VGARVCACDLHGANNDGADDDLNRSKQERRAWTDSSRVMFKVRSVKLSGVKRS